MGSEPWLSWRISFRLWRRLAFSLLSPMVIALWSLIATATLHLSCVETGGGFRANRPLQRRSDRMTSAYPSSWSMAFGLLVDL